MLTEYVSSISAIASAPSLEGSFRSMLSSMKMTWSLTDTSLDSFQTRYRKPPVSTYAPSISSRVCGRPNVSSVVAILSILALATLDELPGTSWMSVSHRSKVTAYVRFMYSSATNAGMSIQHACPRWRSCGRHRGLNPQTLPLANLKYGIVISLPEERFDGQSGGATPGLISNPEVKPAHVLCGTEVREPSGSLRSLWPRDCSG